MGIARVGGIAGNGSGDIFLAFSTANAGAAHRKKKRKIDMLPNDEMTPFFEGTIQATEEAIVNAIVAARTMTGINGHTVHALPHDRLRAVLTKYNWPQPSPRSLGIRSPGGWEHRCQRSELSPCQDGAWARVETLECDAVPGDGR